MKSILITDVLGKKNLITSDDGHIIKDKIKNSLDKETPVVLDFTGTELVITAFLNSCIGELYGEYDETKIKDLLKLEGVDNDLAMSIKDVKETAKLFYSDSEDITKAFNKSIEK